MSNPVAGQWYEWQGSRVYCVGQNSHGHTIVNHECGTLNILRGKLIEELTHLPDCTGWDWQPETFPQYWTANHESIAYIRRDSVTHTVSVWRDGHEGAWLSKWDKVEARSRTRLTESEALALLDPKPQPAEDPEEWVEITDPEHVLRCGVDQVYYYDQWNEVVGYAGCQVSMCTAPVRCRRKDLPKPRRTITVPKWLVILFDGDIEIVNCTETPIGKEVHRVGETTYTEQEDGSWIVS